jgi:GNAT superfamily N-acetyltransferase
VTSIQIRLAQLADVDALMPLVREFYIYERLRLNEARYVELAQTLVGNPELGRMLVVEQRGALIGYAVVGFGFSLEFGGRDALLDEFYLREQHRGSGIGTKVIKAAEELCRAHGIGAIHLEADHFNMRVHEYYKRMGFRDHKRHLMTRWLRPPRS